MKDLQFRKTTHNGLEVYKDQDNLFMIGKNVNGWYLSVCNSESKGIVNELKAWGYERLFNNIRTKKEAILEAQSIIESLELHNGYKWMFNDYQYELIKSRFFQI